MAIGSYESEGHRDRVALAGLLISRSLSMKDSSPNEIFERVRGMESALKIIATWAACDSDSGQTRLDAMQDIRNCAMKALGKEIHDA